MFCSTAETTDTEVILIPNRNVRNLVNTETYGLVICCSAAATANLPVFIRTNIGDIPVLCKALEWDMLLFMAMVMKIMS